MSTDIKDEIARQIGDTLAQVLKRIGDSRPVVNAERAVGETYGQVRRYADDLTHDAEITGRKFVRYANRELRDHPFATLGAGVALGVLVGMVIARQSSTIDS
jgi:ElaB/YqjD/DUF883 family membrane-anchored ribosome-binding protein